MRIAIIGTGISGLSSALLLDRYVDIDVYEKATRIGGHSNTYTQPIEQLYDNTY